MSLHQPSQESNASSRPRGQRPTIGVLLDHMAFFGGSYEAQLRDALHERSIEAEVDLLLIYGRGLDEPHPFCATQNAIYSLPRPENVAGLVVASSLLAAHVGADGIRSFLAQYGALPLCSVGVEVPGIPSVVVDNRGGMASAVEHLIEEHGCTRLAFIGGSKGSPEAELRFDVFRETLARHGLELDLVLVESGSFTRSGALLAMEKILARGVPFDAVVCANDAMAVGAITVLKSHGFRLPREVKVSGFDDLGVARLGSPSITSVAQPFERMAACALDSLLDRLAGRSVPLCVELATALVTRQSCGCFSRDAPTARHPSREARVDLSSRAWRALATSTLAALLKVDAKDRSGDAARLLSALDLELSGQADAFVGTLEQLFDDAPLNAEHCSALRSAIDWLRTELLGFEEPGLQRIWVEALSLIASASMTAQVNHQLMVDDSHLRLLSTGEQVAVALDLDSLRGALVRGLPTFGIKTTFISRCVGEGQEELEAFMWLRDGRELDLPKGRFPGWCLLPPGARDDCLRDTFAIFPLTFEGARLGLAAFQYSPHTRGYQGLREQIAGALRTVVLHRELLDSTMLHERSLLERVSTAKRMESLSVLASGVAHDLNNALGPLVALPDNMLAELEALSLPEATVVELRRDLGTLRSAALRASFTVKDLLTLGRQGKTRLLPLDLNQVVARITSSDASRLTQEASGQLVIRSETSPKPMLIRGSEPHLERALANLLRNAAEALTGPGEIVIRTFACDVDTPLRHYETIEPGQYAAVSVSDSGGGIGPQDLARIFEPYYTKKDLSDGSGSGLGLAIVHGVVKEHEGYIDVVSTERVGTTFTLYFPSCEAPIAAARAPQSRAPRGGRILLVDDDPGQLRTGQRVLSRVGFQVDTASSAALAYEIFDAGARPGESPYDALLVDFFLGAGDNGLEVCERIRRLFPEQRFILMSGQAPDQRVESAIAEGLAWLSKPFTSDDLTAAVEALLSTPRAPRTSSPWPAAP